MTPKSDWRDLAALASVEMDSTRLSTLVVELNHALDEQEALRTKRRNVTCCLLTSPAPSEPLGAHESLPNHVGRVPTP